MNNNNNNPIDQSNTDTNLLSSPNSTSENLIRAMRGTSPSTSNVVPPQHDHHFNSSNNSHPPATAATPSSEGTSPPQQPIRPYSARTGAAADPTLHTGAPLGGLRQFPQVHTASDVRGGDSRALMEDYRQPTAAPRDRKDGDVAAGAAEEQQQSFHDTSLHSHSHLMEDSASQVVHVGDLPSGLGLGSLSPSLAGLSAMVPEDGHQSNSAVVVPGQMPTAPQMAMEYEAQQQQNQRQQAQMLQQQTSPQPPPSPSTNIVIDTATGRRMQQTYDPATGRTTSVHIQQQQGGGGGPRGGGSSGRNGGGGGGRQWELLDSVVDMNALAAAHQRLAEAFHREADPMVATAAAARPEGEAGSATADRNGGGGEAAKTAAPAADTGAQEGAAKLLEQQHHEQPVPPSPQQTPATAPPPPLPMPVTSADKPFEGGGFTFSVFDNDIRRHYNIDARSVMLTTGAMRYIDRYNRYGPHKNSRFQLCAPYQEREGTCPRGPECTFVHCPKRLLPKPTTVHLRSTAHGPTMAATAGAAAAQPAHGAGGEQQIRPEEASPMNRTAGGTKPAYEYLPYGMLLDVHPPPSVPNGPQMQIPSECIIRTVGAVTALNAQLHACGFPPVAFDPEPEGPGGPRLPEALQGQIAAGPFALVRHAGPIPKHCAHFQFKKICHVGYDCHFIHSMRCFAGAGSSGDGGLHQHHHQQAHHQQQQAQGVAHHHQRQQVPRGLDAPLHQQQPQQQQALLQQQQPLFPALMQQPQHQPQQRQQLAFAVQAGQQQQPQSVLPTLSQQHQLFAAPQAASQQQLSLMQQQLQLQQQLQQLQQHGQQQHGQQQQQRPDEVNAGLMMQLQLAAALQQQQQQQQQKLQQLQTPQLAQLLQAVQMQQFQHQQQQQQQQQHQPQWATQTDLQQPQQHHFQQQQVQPQQQHQAPQQRQQQWQGFSGAGQMSWQQDIQRR